MSPRYLIAANERSLKGHRPYLPLSKLVYRGTRDYARMLAAAVPQPSAADGAEAGRLAAGRTAGTLEWDSPGMHRDEPALTGIADY